MSDDKFSVENLRLPDDFMEQFRERSIPPWKRERENKTGEGVFLTFRECAERGLDKRISLRCRCVSDQELVAYVYSDGRPRYRLVCRQCLEWGGDIANRALSDVETTGARVVKTSDPKKTPPCDRCGSHEPTQWHHYWPKALFGDNDYCGAWLCNRCHNLWHKVATPWTVLDKMVEFLKREGLWERSET